MTTPPMYLIKHRRLGSYLAEHEVWQAWITHTRSLATRYATREEAEARRKHIGEDFANFFEVVEESDD